MPHNLKRSYSKNDIRVWHGVWFCHLESHPGLNSQFLHQNVTLSAQGNSFAGYERKMLSFIKLYQIVLSLKTLCLRYLESHSAVRCFSLGFTLNRVLSGQKSPIQIRAWYSLWELYEYMPSVIAVFSYGCVLLKQICLEFLKYSSYLNRTEESGIWESILFTI